LTQDHPVAVKPINEEIENEAEVDCQICKKMFPFSKIEAHEVIVEIKSMNSRVIIVLCLETM